ncbi:MAG: dihydrodipicolinate synthase family protein, partial [Clostridia bacterium]|nr:dihydrodipicolinate synthase family protein [Clostridia bacterium]
MKQAFPTMVTPYNHDGSVDYGAAEAMVEWYWKKGCDGIFAVCQSSEIFYLTLEERAELAKRVKRKADALAAADKSRVPMTIVASGHVSDTLADQVRELSAVAESGADAIILISNRMDIENISDEAWIADTERLIEALPDGLCYGVYECPAPYKRLLTPKMLDFCAKREFRFIKDT